MRILHVGSFTSQHTLLAGLAYEMMGFDVVFFNTQKKTNQKQVSGLQNNFKYVNPYNSYQIKKFGSIYDQLILIQRFMGMHDPKIVNELKSIVTEIKFDFISLPENFPQSKILT